MMVNWQENSKLVQKKLFSEKFPLRPEVHRRLESIDVVKVLKQQNGKSVHRNSKEDRLLNDVCSTMIQKQIHPALFQVAQVEEVEKKKSFLQKRMQRILNFREKIMFYLVQEGRSIKSKDMGMLVHDGTGVLKSLMKKTNRPVRNGVSLGWCQGNQVRWLEVMLSFMLRSLNVGQKN